MLLLKEGNKREVDGVDLVYGTGVVEGAGLVSVGYRSTRGAYSGGK